ncbi:TPA: hypothetical protein DE059_04405 [Candidatus Peribacteria bacterium]|nr:hypothetical protein [Candidatus Peribacteria bacterium]
MQTMIILWLIPGLALPTISGWLILRILEWKTPVLFRFERWALGFLLGLTMMMFVTFVVHITTGLALTLKGYLVVQIGLTIVLGLMHLPIRKCKNNKKALFTFNYSLFTRYTIIILTIWTLIKILFSGITFLMLTPPYLDDTIDNWNLRGKVYFTEERIRLDLPNEEGGLEINPHGSYPPAVPLAKASLASFAGKWSESLVNSLHLLWFLSALILIFYALRREVNLLFAIIGTYILASLPLYLMHGTNPYSDIFLSAHIFAAISMLFHAVKSENPKERMSFFRIGALATALLVFTKNEAMMMYVPGILFILLVSLFLMKKNQVASLKQSIQIFAMYIASLIVVALPWTIFKWMNDLTFGNAQSLLSNLKLSWHPAVNKSMAINTFLEGNWILLFPLFILLLIAKRKEAFRFPILILTGFFFLVFLVQIFLYNFTYLFVEAMYQTGFARGLIHLAPVVVLITTILLSKCFKSAQ